MIILQFSEDMTFKELKSKMFFGLVHVPNVEIAYKSDPKAVSDVEIPILFGFLGIRRSKAIIVTASDASPLNFDKNGFEKPIIDLDFVESISERSLDSAQLEMSTKKDQRPLIEKGIMGMMLTVSIIVFMLCVPLFLPPLIDMWGKIGS